MPANEITETVNTPRAPHDKLAGLRSAWQLRWLRFVVWALASLLLLGLLAYVGVPPLVKWQLQKIASDKLGRAVTVGSVDFKPWSLELTLHDLAMAGAGSLATADAAAGAAGVAGSATPQLAIRRVYVNAELESLLRLAPVADAITVDGPVARLTRLPDGRLDIDDVVARLKPPADAPPGQLPQFSLYNLTVTGGSLSFTDHAVKPGGRAGEASVHSLQELTLAVPFLSNLASQRQITTEPRLAFTLDGSRFDSAAVGTPFAETRKTDASLKIAAFDLQPWLAYLPDSLPFRVRGGVLNADLTIAFAQTPTATVKLSGRVAIDKGLIKSVTGQAAGGKPAADGGDLLAFDQLAVTLADVRPLERVARLSSVELQRPVLDVARSRDGHLNLLPPAATGPSGPKNPARPAASAPATSASASAGTAAPGAAGSWTVELPRAAVQDGTLRWRDASLASAATLALEGLTIEASDIQWPFSAGAPLKFIGSAELDAASLARHTAAQTAQAAAPAAPAAAAVPAPGGKAAAKKSPKSRAQLAAKQKSTASAQNGGIAAPAAQPEPAPKPAGPARLRFAGSATDQAAQVTASLAGWPLAVAAPYLTPVLQPRVSGVLDADLDVKWRAARTGQASVLTVAAPKLALANVTLLQDQASLAAVRRIDVSGLEIDWTARAAKAATLQLTQPELRVERDADRRWMFERWLVGREPAASGADSADATAPRQPPEAPPWSLAVGELAIDAGAVAFSDRAVAPAVAFDIAALNARLGGLTLGGAAAAPAGKAAGADDAPRPPSAAGTPHAQALPVSASLRLSAGRATPPGSVEFKGTMGLEPVQAQGQLTARSFPVQAFEPYFGESLNVDVLRADTGFTGQLAYRQTPAGASASLKGDMTVEQFRSNTLAPAEELLTWKSLKLGGLALSMEPGRATRVDVAQAALTDFFARIIVTPEGRINLQDLVRKPGQAGTVPASETPPRSAAVATNSGANRARIQRAAAPKGSKSEPLGAQPVAAAAADDSPAAETRAARASGGPAAIVNFGPIELASGRVFFSDRFIKPNYSANLTQLNGRLSAFSSVPPGRAANAAPTLADLELRGRAEQSASLEITGKLNPLADPLVLDITGKVRDLELPPLSPYAIKYAGYGITRGRLSMDVNYVVTPAGQLTASNKLVLNQLSFGDKVEGAPASLPVKLAVALLADRNGTINLDIPIRGSLNDPQFSLGPLIVKALVNVVGRAITAPFSLLGKAFRGGGGGGEGVASGTGGPGSAGRTADAADGEDSAGTVNFTAGSALLSADAKSGLDQVAKALAERPALKVTVTGAASLQAERDALKRARLDALVRAEKRRAGGTGAEPAPVSAAQYPALLKEVYRRAELPGRPRNFIGLDKDLPPADMEQLLLASIEVDDNAVRELAAQRAAAVKDYLAAAGLPPERLLVGAAKTQSGAGPWTPRAELNLAPQ